MHEMAVAGEAVGELALYDVEAVAKITFAGVADEEDPHFVMPETEVRAARAPFWRCSRRLATHLRQTREGRFQELDWRRALKSGAFCSEARRRNSVTNCRSALAARLRRPPAIRRRRQGRAGAALPDEPIAAR